MSKHFVAGRPEPTTDVASPSLWSPPPTWAGLAGQIRDAIDDLPRFPAAPLQRRWHQTWGHSSGGGRGDAR
jgi:hypothetical protein